MSSTAIPLSPAQSAPTGPTRLRWFVCLLLFLATTVNYMDRSVLSLIEPALHDLPFLGWNDLAPITAQSLFNNNFGNILIAFQIAYGVGFLFAGRLIDRLGTKLGYTLAILLWSAGAMAHALVGSVAGFAAARFLLGLGEAGNFPAAIKAVTEWFPVEQRALATGLFNSGTNAASLVAPWLIPLVTVRYGWKAAFFSTGALGLLWLALWLPFPYNRLRPATAPTADTPDVSSSPQQTPSPEPPIPVTGTASAVPYESAENPASAAAVRSSPNPPLIPGAPSLAQPFRDVDRRATDPNSPSPEPLQISSRTPQASYATLLRQPATWAFSAAKFLADPVWWFYLFWLPKYFHETYGLTLTHLGPPLITIYFVSSLGSVAGGALAGLRMRQGHSVLASRRFALLLCACGALPVMLVPLMARLSPASVWPAVALLSLAAAAHQGWSANLYNAPGDTFPAAEVSTVVGIGSAAGALGGALFTALTKTLWTSHPFVIFFLGSVAYLVAYVLFRTLSPRAVAAR